MRLGLLVNDVEGEDPRYTTTAIAMAARGRDHEVWYLEVADFAYDPDNLIRARAVEAPPEAEDGEAFIETLASEDARRERITVNDLDVLFLRNDPAEDLVDRPWAQSTGIVFGQMAADNGVLVVNDPFGLSRALNKLYFQGFPQELTPKTLITRDSEEIRSFFREHGGSLILKPLQGSGGHNVFLVREDDEANLEQMVEAIARDGYVVAQEYLPAAAEGDLRLFLMNGHPLRREDAYAAMFRRTPDEGLRSNVRAGGTVEEAVVDEAALRIAEAVRPKLVKDGMFLAGLDIAGDKLMEVNVFTPGGFGRMRELTGVDFGVPVVRALERKVEWTRRYGLRFPNADLAVL